MRRGERGRRRQWMKIGIPRALLFFKYGALWTVFFESLGAKVLFSPKTHRGLLQAGASLAVDETCLPVKVFLGHVASLRGRVDCVFVPRVESVQREEWLCTKFLGLIDICRNTFTDLQWLELNMSPAQEGISQRRAFWRLGRRLSSNPLRIWRAYRRALEAQARFERWVQAGLDPERALNRARTGQTPETTPIQEPSSPRAEANGAPLRIALLGHAYATYDEFIGAPIVKRLRRLGAEVLTVEGVDPERARRLAYRVSETIYWTYNKEILGAAVHYLERGVDGIVFLMTFPCGPDALATDLAVRKLKGQVPIMTLVLDELQAEGGLQTRLESFLDVIRMRKEEAEARV